MSGRVLCALVAALIIVPLAIDAAQPPELTPVLVRFDGKLVLTTVVAHPGDRVQIAEGELLVNGRLTGVRIDDAGSWGPEVIAPRTYFVAGDPATLGNDARAWGLVPETRIIGTVQIGAVPR